MWVLEHEALCTVVQTQFYQFNLSVTNQTNLSKYWFMTRHFCGYQMILNTVITQKSSGNNCPNIMLGYCKHYKHLFVRCNNKQSISLLFISVALCLNQDNIIPYVIS